MVSKYYWWFYWWLVAVLVVVLVEPTLAQGFKKGRFRIMPTLSFAEEYNNNVYQTHEDRQGDFVFRINPTFSLDFALLPRNYFSLIYDGNYQFYKKCDNFREFNHSIGLLWQWRSLKHSFIKLGAVLEDKAYQPYSATQEHKDYTKWNYLVKTKLVLSEKLAFSFDSSYEILRLEKEKYAQDEYDSGKILFAFAYRYFPYTAMVCEYGYYNQDYKDIFFSRDYATHWVAIGFLRESKSKKLRGKLKLGYLYTDLERGGNYSDIMSDIDLFYYYRHMIFRLRVSRIVYPSLSVNREIGDYYLSSKIKFSIFYKYRPKFDLDFGVSYRNDKFKISEDDRTVRTDDNYKVYITFKYSLKPWLFASLDCSHSENKSTYKPTDYIQNSILFKISFLNLYESNP